MSTSGIKNDKLTTSNKKILEFYEKNPHINFESINCLIIDFLENMLTDLSCSINNNITTDILNNVKDISNELVAYKNTQIFSNTQLQTELINMKEVINKLNTDITNSVVVKLVDLKKTYIDEVKQALFSSDATIQTIIEKQNDITLSKTINVINEIIPKNQNIIYNQFELLIIKFKEEVNIQLRDISKTNSDFSIVKLSNILDNKYTQLITNLQQPILSYITASEDRLNTNITQIKDTTQHSSFNQDKINEQLTDFLNKYNTTNSNNIGKLGEDKLCHVLNRLYPSSHIEDTSGKSKQGDFILKRNNMIDILFENKHYTNNVPKDEVIKFIRDCDENNFSGIMISNTSGIATKSNFQIDIHAKNILIYLHNTNYNEDVIHTAVDILDYLTDAISSIDPDNFNPLTNEQLLDINQEFQTFLNQKETIINYIRDTNKRLIQQILDIELPSLQKYLSAKFATTKTLDLKCDICHKFTGKNNKSIASHKKSCAIKTQDSLKSTGSIEINNVSSFDTIPDVKEHIVNQNKSDKNPDFLDTTGSIKITNINNVSSFDTIPDVKEHIVNQTKTDKTPDLVDATESIRITNIPDIKEHTSKQTKVEKNRIKLKN